MIVSKTNAIAPADLAARLPTIEGAQHHWEALSLDERCRRVRAVGAVFARRAEEVASLVVAETKKSPTDAWFADVVPNLDLFDYWTTAGAEALDTKKAPISQLKFPKKSGILRYEPKGLIGLITPWNYPVALALRTLVPALVAGNAVLLKASEYTPGVGPLLADIFAEALGPDLVVAVSGAADGGEAVIDACNHVVFIGSVGTGKKVALRAAATLKSTSLELGGKDAAIVLADCDFERTVAGVFWGAMANSGQNCAAIERCYVQRTLYDRFVAALVAFASKVEIAPLATDAQAATVARHLEDAQARGAKLHGGGPGRATILTDVPEDALIATEETFGPVLPIWPVESLEGAIPKANKGNYGLTTSIWTTDLALAQAAVSRFDTGVVTINNTACTAAMPFAPWSGRRDSGTGTTNSHLAIYELVKPKFVLTDANKDPEVWWHPFDAESVALARQTVGWLTATGISKIKQTIGLMSAMKRRVQSQKDFVSRP